MALNNNAMIAAANELRSIMLYMQTHYGDPGVNGTSNVNTGARQSITWTAATNDGDFGLASSIVFTGIAPNNAVTYVTLWGAISGGTFYGPFATSGDQQANSNGEYTVTALNLNGSAT